MIRTDILLLNRSFWPDTEATGQTLTELCDELAKRYKVTVIAGRSYYIKHGCRGFLNRESFGGIEIIRINHTTFWKGCLIGRLINWFTFSVLAFMAGLRIKPRIIIVCTDPPFLGIIVLALSYLKSVPFIYNCRDLFPEVAQALGKIKKTNALGVIFDRLNIKAFRRAKLVVCLSPSMENAIRAKGVESDRIKSISNWADASIIKPISRSENPLLKEFGLSEKFIIMHSGNIGLSQNLDLILESASAIRARHPFNLLFAGAGVNKERLMSLCGKLRMQNILFLPYQPKEMLSFSLSMGDLHIISLVKGMDGAIIPSKLYGILAVGRPYLAVTDRGSEPARLAEEFGCGLWRDPEDKQGISDAMIWAMEHPEELKKMGRRGRDLAETKFDKKIVVSEWFKVLEELNV